MPLARWSAVVVLASCGHDAAGPGPPVFRTVSAGYLHTCAVTVEGVTYCWGEDRLGALGNGQRDTNRLAPVPVGGGLNFAAVSAGGLDSGHTCGVNADGSAYCWGNALFGRLGDGTSALGGAVAPRAVAGASKFTAISAGYESACGLATDGAILCWGDGTWGQLGNGLFSTYALAPVRVIGALGFVAVSAGGQHACGVAAGGAGYCWGYNGLGALGTGLPGDTSRPAAVAGGLAFVAISAGLNHSCGLNSDSTAWCWGYNGYGRLGNGSTTGSGVPVAATGGLHFAAIRAGGYHTCGLASGGRAYCWGLNESGQVGDGTTADRTVPAEVAGALSFSSVSAGWRHSCGVTTDGAIYCWGLNDHGQLGNGTMTASSVPVRVGPPAL